MDAAERPAQDRRGESGKINRRLAPSRTAKGCNRAGMNAQTAFLLFLAGVAVAVIVTRLRPARRDSDLAITAAVNAAILGDFRFSTSQVDVKTFDGVVILGGF
ncbi:MAG: hypothetical protein Q7I92_01005, partial [Humidesulfovibrio sp.]|nr:hypothetical protein [Humidesulfovibrio sp.]